MIGLRNRKGGAIFARHALLFLLDNQVLLIFYLNNCLIFHLCCNSFLFYEGGGWSTFYEKWVIGLRNRKGGAIFARHALFFLLDNQVL